MWALNSFGIECFYFFALMQKSNKKINPANKKAEILNVSLKSRNSPVEYVSLKEVLAQTALIFLRLTFKISSTFYSMASNIGGLLSINEKLKDCFTLKGMG
jgi:hypothetical protein